MDKGDQKNAEAGELPDSKFGEFEETFRPTVERLGGVTNSVKIMARKPEITKAWSAPSAKIMGTGTVDRGLKTMINHHIASRAAGCNYCMAHTGHASELLGVSAEKDEALWDFENSPPFDEGERAALRVTLGAGQVPDCVTDEDFDALKAHFDDTQFVEIVAVISMFGFLNRWNDTMSTELEASPLAFGRAHLEQSGWNPEKHIRD